MSPRTRIREDQTEDLSFLSEFELNEFFSATVVTGTETDTSVIQTFADYFPGRGLITAGAGITVTTGTNFVQVSSPGATPPLPLVGDPFISVVTGTNTVKLYTDAIVGGTGITVVSGVNTVTISSTAASATPNAIVSGSPDLTVTSGVSTIVISDNNRAILAQSQGTNSLLAVSSGTNTISLTTKAIVPDATGFLSVTSGTSTVLITADAIIAGAGIQVTSGTNSVTITNTGSAGSTPNAIVGVTGNTTVISGSSTTTVSGVVTVTSGIGYINDSTRGGKALSVYRTSYLFNYEGNADNTYLRVGDVSNIDAGWPVYRPATITAISAHYPSGAASKDFEIRKNGVATSLRTFTVIQDSRFTADAENIDLNTGDYLQVFSVAAGNGVSDVTVAIEVAWRLP